MAFSKTRCLDLEGPSTEGTVVLQVPNMEAAKACCDGSAYREVRVHRFKGTNDHVTLVNGV
jgi:uncharacterized protein (DUF1330 family)